METRKERQRMLTRRRVANHRQRKAEAVLDERERRAQRANLVEQYGEDRVADWEWTNRSAKIASEILLFLQHEPSKTNDSNIAECIDLIERWAKYYEKDSDLDDLYQRGMRLGLFPKPQDAGAFFRAQYQNNAAGEQ
jgi:hypothetical protein